MKELGLDTMDNSPVIIARERANRPIENVGENTKGNEDNEYVKTCPFCKGNEKELAEETESIKLNGEWIVKSVKNKYPIIDDNKLNRIKGSHEVIIESNEHNKSFFTMDENEFFNLLLMYKNRFNALKKDENIKYICLFKNYLRQAGASLMHPHSQILSLPVVPPNMENEYKICEKFYKKTNKNMYHNLIEKELQYEKRVVHNHEKFLVFIPEICKFSGDTVILFKENIYFSKIDNDSLKELSIIMKKLFTKIYKSYGNCPFNLYLHCHPVNTKKDYKDKYNVHIHIVPRKFNLGGFELSTGMYISSVDSEDIAKKLKFD